MKGTETSAAPGSLGWASWPSSCCRFVASDAAVAAGLFGFGGGVSGRGHLLSRDEAELAVLLGFGFFPCQFFAGMPWLWGRYKHRPDPWPRHKVAIRNCLSSLSSRAGQV
mmetsp:Transcript_33184/g.83950  ORF Transcript_33184/g.83950 Transcript_33184/m.83950 type:complete len:110 (-) Transcript_33184:69-398(-)